jgi:hypothetical protein
LSSVAWKEPVIELEYFFQAYFYFYKFIIPVGLLIEVGHPPVSESAFRLSNSKTCPLEIIWQLFKSVISEFALINK